MSGRYTSRAVAIPAAIAVALSLAAPVVAAPSPSPDLSELKDAASNVKLAASSKIVSNLDKGRVYAFVQVAATNVVAATDAGEKASVAKKKVETKANEVAEALPDSKAQVLYTTTNAISGFAVHADADALTKLAERDDVVAIRPLTLRTPSNSGTNQLTKALDAWKYSGATGDGVTIAVIDSGVDFTHKSFGGTGDYSPYADAKARTEAPKWPIGNVIGGWDFVGEDYSPSGNLGSREAVADPNPIDIAPEVCKADPRIQRSGGHGTHVAGTAAGKGVTAEGETFAGDYSKLTGKEMDTFKVPPGSAPKANILAFKVFGCAGSTGHVPAALDELLAKKDDGSYKWPKVDIVNMSLGGMYSPAGDPENLIVDALFKERGIVSVVAAGNDGDMYDIAGSPGNAITSLTVANSTHGVSYFDVADSKIGDKSEKLTGQYSVEYQWKADTVGPQEIVALTGDNSEACAPLSAEDAAKVSGKAALIDWNEKPALKCGSAARFDNIAAAGGTGVVLKSEVNRFEAGIAGNKAIPGFQLTAANTEKVVAALAKGPVSVTFNKKGTNAERSFSQTDADKLNSSSSRGVHGTNGVVKPDVAAPGTHIVSAAVGEGVGSATLTGTSMATPHIAGVAALVRESHKNWSATQLKAGIMNTAFHDITDGKNVFGPQRVGTGRVDAKAAVDNGIVMFDSQAPSLASVTFGVVEFGQQGYQAERKVTIQNTGKAAAALQLAYNEVTPVPGVKYSVSPASVQVPAGGQVEVTVSMSVDAKAYKKVIDPTMNLTQKPAQLGGTQELPREFLSTPGGVLVAKGTGAPEGGELRLPVSSTVKPVSDLKATAMLGDDNTGVLKSDGETFEYRTAHKGTVNDFLPIALPMEFVAASPEKVVTGEAAKYADLLKSTDIKRVGVISNIAAIRGGGKAEDAQVTVGLETYGAWPISPAAPGYLALQVEAKGKKFTVEATRLRGSDVTIVAVFNEAGKNAGLLFVNQVPSGALDTNTFDSAVLALPFSLKSVGFSDEEIMAKNNELDLKVRAVGRSWYASASTDEGLAVGETDAVSFEYKAGKPRISFGSNLGVSGIDLSADGTSIPFTVNAEREGASQNAPQANGGDKFDILYFHFHNKVGEQTELLALPTTGEPTEKPTEEPTGEPTEEPTGEPTEQPTGEPTEQPTGEPTAKPTDPGRPGLPITGGEVTGLILFAMVLLGGGALLIRRKIA